MMGLASPSRGAPPSAYMRPRVVPSRPNDGALDKGPALKWVLIKTEQNVTFLSSTAQNASRTSASNMFTRCTMLTQGTTGSKPP